MKDVIRKYVDMPFEYGNDCCAFVGECVESITGDNPMNVFNYQTEAEAAALLGVYGGLERAITATLGQPYDDIKDGDVCLINSNDGRHAAGIVFQGRIVARVANGLMDYPLERALRVWCV